MRIFYTTIGHGLGVILRGMYRGTSYFRSEQKKKKKKTREKNIYSREQQPSRLSSSRNIFLRKV